MAKKGLGISPEPFVYQFARALWMNIVNAIDVMFSERTLLPVQSGMLALKDFLIFVAFLCILKK
jgi:hypothetical protein